ncbi:MAG: hypothetical protein IKX22_04380 [Prevotella sp.]|nr:hypothetical protein [Prevotella sp.]
MKFYIPTSNLNLDNILQSECILPFSHYSRRCSGYNSFEQIEELRSFDAIVLFKYPVQFQINDTGRYNFPMLIELEDDNQTFDFSDKEIQEGVCLCNHRLNLTPLNSRFYFFTESTYRLTLINTESNKAIKYFKEYKIYPTASMLKPVKLPHLNKMSIEISKFEDNFIDKQKGLLYAFMLGSKMSVNRDLARQLRLTQELYNILTNLISSPSSIPSFDTKLNNLINEYKQVDSVEKKSQKVFQEKFDAALGKRFLFLKGYLIDFLKKIDCWDLVWDALCRKWNCSFLTDISKFKTGGDFSSLRNEIERRTQLATSEYSSSISYENMNNIYISGDYILFTEARLVNVVIKYIIDNSITPETLLAQRMNFYMSVMSEIVSILKVEMGELKWKESEEKAYVNSLYAFINDPTFSFNLNGIDNLELKSIAAFILKGHSFKDCVIYLRNNEFQDYRFVLSLWGCLCGYMEMNKEALSKVLTMGVYELAYKKLFGSELAKITQVSLPPQVLERNSLDLDFYRQILTVFKYKDLEELINNLKRQNPSEDNIEICLNSVLAESPFKKARKQCANACQALKIYLNRENKTVITGIIENTDLSKSGKKAILSLLGFDEPKQRKNARKTAEQAYLFPNLGTNSEISSITKTSDLFVDDMNAANYIWSRSYLPKEVRDILRKKILSFQADYAPDGYYYKNNPRTNDNTINHFIRKCTYQKEHSPYPSWIPATNENKNLLERLKTELYERYAN